jgi:hypothetical protein
MYSPQMATEMVDETLRFASYVILQGDGRLATLLTAPYSFPGPSVRGLYGLPPMANPAMTPVMLDPARRGGLLTQPAFLAAHAHANQSSPVTRGKAIRVNLLCDPPAPPPPDVNTVPPDPAPGLTTRQRFAVHEAEARCAGCHVAMDPIGFGFESYDAIGVYRTLDAGQPVDARGQLSFTDVDGPFNGAVELATKLAGSNQVRMCVTKQWFQYAFGRSADADANDACSYWSVLGAFQTSSFNVRELLIAIVSADAFRFRRAP